MVFSPPNRTRVFTLALFASFCFAATNSPLVHAYQGTGYFSGSTTCTTNFDWSSQCGLAFASISQNNVIYGGGPDALSGVTSNNKQSFIKWLTQQHDATPVVNRGNTTPDTATKQNKLGSQFIIATMLKDPDEKDNLTEVIKRINNPAISMNVVIDTPEDYGSISFSGKNISSGARDEFFVPSYKPGVAKKLLVFKNSTGHVVYVLEYPCANPIGGLPGLPGLPSVPESSSSWAMSGRTTVSSPTVSPGQSVTFRHFVKNAGPDTSSSILASSQVSGGAGTAKSSPAGTFGFGIEKQTVTDTFTIPSNATQGTQYCQRSLYKGTSSSNSGTGYGEWVCTAVAASYTLTPHVTTPSAIAKQGDLVTFSYSVSNSTSGTATNATTHVSRAIIIPPSVSLPASFFAQKDDIAGCSTYVALVPGVTCTDGSPGSRTYPAGSSTTSEGNETVSLNYPVGTRVCRTFSVYPRDASGNSARNRDSVLSCVLIAVSPYVSIVGGNVWSGGSTVSPYTGASKVTASAPSSFGSFADYGVFSTGEVNYFGSAGQLGKVSSASPMDTGTRLTFANKKAAGSSSPNLGSYASSHKITDMSAVPTSAAVVTGSIPIPGTGVYRTTSDITITTSNMAPGNHVSIYAPNNTVTINGNITYNTSGVSSFAQLPSLTIVAKRIQISGAVAEIAGNFYASSSFVTCYQGPGTPAENATKSAAITSTGACTHRLDIHGSVTVANQAVNSLVLNRSSGGTTYGEPAEVIQMRPEVFLTAYELSAKSASMTVTTLQETELPARY